jgi:selenocysteine-specific elongation factor
MTACRHFILATAGHVDHGKSALVKALTGTDPDRLPEEQARGITIELGFAHLELPAEATPVAAFSLGIVDVPGHEDFVRNMVAGVGSVDLALLVVAADDGWMPQTEEHLQILEYLGVRRAVVALTKSDLAVDLAGVTTAVRARLKDSVFADAVIVPTSVLRNTGLDELRHALSRACAELPAPRDLGRPRLAVDRAFSLKGFGTIVTGTLSGGCLRVGQEVIVQPTGRSARVRALQSHGQSLAEARPGMRTALNLPELTLAATGQPGGVGRGQVITVANVGAVSATWELEVGRSRRSSPPPTGTSRPLKSGVRVRVHHGSASHPARLLLLEAGELSAGESGLAQLRFETPVHGAAGDRLVIRDWSERFTLAGGLVLVPAAEREGARKPVRREMLHRLRAAMTDPAAWLETVLAQASPVELGACAPASPFGLGELRPAAERLIAAGTAIVLAGDLLVSSNGWQRWLEEARKAIAELHRASPEKPGLPVVDLRTRFKELNDAVFALLLAALEGAGHERNGAFIRAATHRLKLPPELEPAGRRVRRLLAEKPLEPPSRGELAPDAATHKALRFLIDSGEAVELGPDLVLGAEAYATAVRRLTSHLRRQGAATVSELRPVLGTTRRILIPLLEHLDKRRVTLRQGDQRTLGPAA